MRIERNEQEAKNGKGAFKKRKRQPKMPQVNSPTPSPPRHTAVPPYRRFDTIEGRRHQFCTVCALITNLALVPTVWVGPTCKRILFVNSSKCRCHEVDNNLLNDPTISIVDS